MANPLVFEYPVTIRESHLDTFGHVNNAQYLSLFEEARWELITERGFGLKEIKETQTGPVVLEANLKFKRELKLREKIVIKTYAPAGGGKVVSLKQEMVKADGAVACEATFVIAFFDTKARKIIEPSPAWKKALGYLD
jgi:YbgC/YbaW family acyl-CoA thioester hydrolase